MGDLIKGRYWQKVADARRAKSYSVMLADKNAPNEEVWRQIEEMCRSTKSSAIPVVPDSEGTERNPFSLDALAVFIFRVLHRVNHPGNLDKSTPNAGYVLLMFYDLYDGRSREEFETDLNGRFGSLVKIPLLKSERSPLPGSVKSILEEGMKLYHLHTSRHRRLEPTKGIFAKQWAKWEKELRHVLFANADYLNSIQVPFEFAVKQVLEQLRAIATGETPATGKRRLGTIVPSLQASSNNSGEAVGQPAKPQCPAPAKPVPPPGTYVVQVPKDQIYRYPPPENARRFNALSKRKPRRSCCCRWLCYTLYLLVALIVALGVAAGVLYLVFRPESPKYTVSGVAIKGLNLTSPSPISPEFDVTIRAENPNDKIGIYYRKGSSVTVFHSDVKLCEGALPAFYQPSNNVTVFPTALKGSNVVLGSAVKSVIANQQRQGGVPFRLNIKAPVKIKIGAVKTWKITVKVKCDVTVDALTEKSNVISKDCKYSARPW